MMSALGYLVLVATVASWVACYFRPAFALVLVMVLYTTKQLLGSYLPVFVTNSAWFNYLIFAGVCIAVVSAVTRTPNPWRGYWHRSFALVMFLYLYALFAILYSLSPETAIARSKDGAPYWIMQVVMLPLAMVSLREIRGVYLPFIVIGSIAMVLFYINPNTSYYTGRLTLNLGYFAGATDVRGNPLATAQMGGQVAIVAALLLPARAGWMVNGIRLGALFFGLGIAVAAGSRAQFLLAILIIVAFWPISRSVRNIKQFFINTIGFGAMAVVALVAIRFFISQNVDQDARWNPQTQLNVVGERAAAAWRLIEAWAGDPVRWPFGLGTNAYAYISGEEVSYAHNFYIEMAGELGLLGLVCSLFLTAWLFRGTRDLWNHYRHDPADRATVAVLLAVAAYNFLLGLKQGTFVGIPEPFFLAVIACRLAIRARSEAWVPLQESPAEDDRLALDYGRPEVSR